MGQIDRTITDGREHLEAARSEVSQIGHQEGDGAYLLPLPVNEVLRPICRIPPLHPVLVQYSQEYPELAHVQLVGRIQGGVLCNGVNIAPKLLHEHLREYIAGLSRLPGISQHACRAQA